MDNYFQKCPAMMEDGNFLCDYRSSYVRELGMKKNNNISNNNDFRQFLQNNSVKMMDDAWNKMKENTCIENGCISTNTTYVHSGYFNEQLKKYNKMMQNEKAYPCQNFNDYRIGFNN